MLSFDLDVTKIIKSVEDDAAGAIAGMCLPAWNALLLNDIRFQSSSVCTNITPHLLATLTRIFKGTTRNSFKGLRSRLICCKRWHCLIMTTGKVVTRLEYQAYSKLAVKTMADIVQNAQAAVSRSAHDLASQSVPSLIRCAVHHRLGTVPVGEPSIGTHFSLQVHYLLTYRCHSHCSLITSPKGIFCCMRTDSGGREAPRTDMEERIL